MLLILHMWWMHGNTEEFLELHKKPAADPITSRKRLSKPPREWLKINSDGAYSASSGAGGWGFVTRDHEGDVVVAGAGALKHVRDALHAEAFACLQGAMAAADKGIGNTILEMDSLILRQALESDSYRFFLKWEAIYTN